MDDLKRCIALKIDRNDCLSGQDVPWNIARDTNFLFKLLQKVQQNGGSEKQILDYQMHILSVFVANGCYITNKDLAYWLIGEVSWRTIVYLWAFTEDIAFMTYVMSINFKARYYLPKDRFGNRDEEFYNKHKESIKYAISIGKIRPKEIKQR